MISVGLARTRPDYGDVRPPYHPAKAYPELASLLGDEPAGGGGANPGYAGVRAALAGLGLDADHLGGDDWNPLGELVERGGSVVLKPNFIRHWNPEPGESVESVITHGAIVRAVADYAFLAVGPEGSVTIAEAPQMDCEFARIREITGLDALARFYEEALGLELAVVDLRREEARFEDGVVCERTPLPGDPKGYRVVDLGDRSIFAEAGLASDRYRGADYDPAPTTEHHSGGRHEYLLSETVLSADLVVNLPKLKTHKKTGVTLAFKNLVGINGDKNWLPHHSLGAPSEGGDEYPEPRPLDRWRSRATEWARPLLQRGRGVGFFRLARRLETAARGDDFVRAGNWHGNRTTWRMCLDLNRCFYYSDAKGFHPEAGAPVRRALTVLDGVVAGEGKGPLAPRGRGLGAVVAGVDPLAVDLAAVRLMGFDEARLPKLREAMADEKLRITAVRSPADVVVLEVDADTFVPGDPIGLDDIETGPPFVPHPGWCGAVERKR